MKLIIGLLAAAGLSGCVAYPAGYYGGGAYYGEPGYVYGGYSRGYRHDGRGYRDRDGDGVPNRADSAPRNPYRY